MDVGKETMYPKSLWATALKLYSSVLWVIIKYEHLLQCDYPPYKFDSHTFKEENSQIIDSSFFCFFFN